jgi:hypothetical protein
VRRSRRRLSGRGGFDRRRRSLCPSLHFGPRYLELALRPAAQQKTGGLNGLGAHGTRLRARAVAGSDPVALVELIAAHFALRLGAIVGVHRQYPLQHLR